MGMKESLVINTDRPNMAVQTNKKSMWLRLWEHRISYLFISPFYILFLVFGVFPILFSLFLAFQSWTGLGKMKFVGLAQFKYLLTEPDFWHATSNTFSIWIISTIPMLFFALVIAFLLNLPLLKFRGIYRTLFFLTNVTSIVAVTIIFQSVFNSNYGLLNYLLSAIGLPTVKWLDNPLTVKIVLASMVVWRWTGYNAIIYLAGLQRIPQTLYEAATIDGANRIQMFFRITIPLLRPIILFTVIMTTIGSMQIFTEPQVLLGNTGGIGNAGMTLTLYMYNQAFIQSQFGYAAAVSWVMFIIIGLFSLLNWKLVQRV